MYNNVVGSSLALLLTLDQPQHHWLAEYFVTRYPTSAESNPTLPRDLVADRLEKNLLADQPVDHLIDAHVLTPTQWRAVLDTLPAGLRVDYLVVRQWPRKDHMVAAALRDDTSATATMLVRNTRSKSFWSLPLDDQIHIVERADTCTRLSWLGRSTDPRLLQRFGPAWITEGNGKNFSVCLAALVEEQRHRLDFFIGLDDSRVNEALADTRHLKTVEDQRRVVHLDQLRSSASSSEVKNWCFRNHQAVRLLLNNPRCQLAVREEVAALLKRYLHEHQNKLNSNYQVRALNVALRTAGLYSPIVGEYEEVEDERDLHRLSTRCLNAGMPPGYPSRRYDAAALLRNPQRTPLRRVLVDYAAHPRDHASPYHFATTRDLRRQWQRQRSETAPVGSFVQGVQDTVQWFLRHLRQGGGLPEGFTGWLVDTLGNTPSVWDTFLTLSENWEGTFSQLVEVAKNLNERTAP